jgi:amino acid efflux transporter
VLLERILERGNKMKKIKLIQAIPLGIGSIIGSGILFLPSLTYKVSGADVLVSWLLIMFLCIPGIFFCNEIIKILRPENTSLSGMIELGLGKELGRAVNLILLGTVVFGMPSAAIVAGEYCAEAYKIDGLKVLVPFLLITTALIVNYFGIKASAIISSFISGIIVLLSTYLICTTSQPITSYTAFKPDWDLNNIYSGAVLSFWAFAGFENLTFLYEKFENPRRDLVITIGVSILVCGFLYLGLVANYSAIVPYLEIQNTTGLIQMAEYIGGKHLPMIIAAFAFFAVAINLISWTGGVTQLVMQASSQGVLPKYLANKEDKSLMFMGLLFYISLIFGLSSPSFFKAILTTVSTNFLVLYLLLIVSYFLIARGVLKKTISLILIISILVTLSSSSFLLLYPFFLFLVSYFKTMKYA